MKYFECSPLLVNCIIESLAAHTKLKATHSVPYSAAGVPLLESQQEEEEDENDSQQVNYRKLSPHHCHLFERGQLLIIKKNS